MAQWAAFGTTSATWWADGMFDVGADVWIQLGVNDLYGGATAATLEANMSTVVGHVRDLGARYIYANTIAPDGAGNEANRTAYNAWLLANSLGLDGIADFAAKEEDGGMADNSDVTQLFAAFNCGDNLHWSDAGHVQAAALTVSTVTP
jgi:hypothetical protein